MEYTLDLVTTCETEDRRIALEKRILVYVTGTLEITTRDITSTSREEVLELSWTGTDMPFEQFRDYLLKIAPDFKVCFEVDYNSDEITTGIVFIGVGANDNEIEYLFDEFHRLIPRMLKRSSALSSRLGVPEREIAKALTLFMKKRPE